MSDQPVAKEMRKSVRKVLLSHAIFVSQRLRVKSAVTIDISSGGMSLTIPEALEVGKRCAISFDVPGRQDMRQRTLIRGTVASCVARDGGYRIGVHYEQSDPVSKQLIQAAIDSHLEQAH